MVETSNLFLHCWVLLQMAVAEVINPRDPFGTLKVGIVFDGGSQKYYLTQRVKDSLAFLLIVSSTCQLLPSVSGREDPSSVK